MDDFEAIYVKYFKDVYRFILKLSHDEHIAEEITAETFFKAIKSIKDFRGDCNIKVWLCQIAKNTYYSYIKKNSSADFADSLDDSEQYPDLVTENLEDVIIANHSSASIRQILHDLPENYKEVFMWRVYADLNFKQIGQIFNKTENWACVTYHRARLLIKQKLEETEK